MTIDRVRAATLLHDTADLISSVKSIEYGDPDLSFRTIAVMWSTYKGVQFTVQDVGMMMVLLKVVRNSRGKHKKDNCVDICGYAALVGSDEEVDS